MLTQQQKNIIEQILDGYRDYSYTIDEVIIKLKERNLEIIGKPEPIRVKMNDKISQPCRTIAAEIRAQDASSDRPERRPY